MTDRSGDGVVHIWTDGSVVGGTNPGKGGWAFVLRFGDNVKIESGWCPHATNNEVETLAAVRALEALRTNTNPVVIFTDSQYVYYGIQRILRKSMLDTHTGLWTRFRDLAKPLRRLSVCWTKAHAKDGLNNLADAYAKHSAREQVDWCSYAILDEVLSQPTPFKKSRKKKKGE
jgi:ribonuclease HI